MYLVTTDILRSILLHKSIVLFVKYLILLSERNAVLIDQCREYHIISGYVQAFGRTLLFMSFRGTMVPRYSSKGEGNGASGGPRREGEGEKEAARATTTLKWGYRRRGRRRGNSTERQRK